MNLELIMALNSLLQTAAAVAAMLAGPDKLTPEQLTALRDRARASERELEEAIERALQTDGA